VQTRTTAVRDRRGAPSLTITQLWQLLAIALPVLGALLAALPAVDLAYHLRAGGELLDTGRITLTDSYTFTRAGEPWLNQQWGAQAVLALVQRAAGWEGLAVLRAALVGCVFALVLWACRRVGASPRQAALLTLAAFVVSIGALALRPQLFGMVLFAVAVALVADRRRHPGRLWLLVPLTAVWANLHGSFFLGPAILGFAWLEDLHDREPGARRTFLVSAAAAVATLVNPFVLGVWGYALGLSTSSLITSSITEWQPTSIRTPLGALFFASALAVLALIARRSRVTPWPTLVWLGFLFALGAYAVRGTAWWPLAAAVVTAGLIERPAVEHVRAERPRRLNDVLAAAIVVVIVVLLPWWKPADPETGRRGLVTFAPSALTTELRALAEPGDRLLAPQPWASWFEYAVPALPVYVDSRIELMGPDLWEEYVSLVNLNEGWRAVLDGRGVTIVVVDPERTAELGAALDDEPSWRRAHVDDDGAIFVRSDR
jgi:hypothetical protein